MTVFVCDGVLAYFIFLFLPNLSIMDVENLKTYVHYEIGLLDKTSHFQEALSSSAGGLTVQLLSQNLNDVCGSYPHTNCVDILNTVSKNELELLTNTNSIQLNLLNALNGSMLCHSKINFYVLSNIPCDESQINYREAFLWRQNIEHFARFAGAHFDLKWIGELSEFDGACKPDTLENFRENYWHFQRIADYFQLRIGLPIDSLSELYAQNAPLYYFVVILLNFIIVVSLLGLTYVMKYYWRRMIVKNLSRMRRYVAERDNENFAVNEKTPHDKWEFPGETLVIDRTVLLGSGAFANVFKGELSLTAPTSNDGKTAMKSGWSGATNARLTYFFTNIGSMEECKNAINVAIKMPRNSANTKNSEEFWREVELMKTIDFHPHILNLIGYVRFGYTARTTTKSNNSDLKQINKNHTITEKSELEEQEKIDSNKEQYSDSNNPFNINKNTISNEEKNKDDEILAIDTSNVAENDATILKATVESNHNSADAEKSIANTALGKGADKLNAYTSSPSAGSPLLVLEYCAVGDLLKLLRQNKRLLFAASNKLLPEDDNELDKSTLPKIQLEIRHLFSFAWQISDAMMYLASKGFVHRDIAARNVLVTRDIVAKLSDFGLCRQNTKDEQANYRAESGKLPIKWMALEALTAFKFNEKTDVWSFGILLYEIFSAGATPYADVNAADVLRYLTEGNRLEQPKLSPNNIYDLMRRCWESDPAKRPTFDEIRREVSVELKLSDDLYGYVDFYATVAAQNSIDVPQEEQQQII